MQQIKFVALGLAGILAAFLFLDLMGYGWGLFFTWMDPAHPEKFGHVINFMRGLACTGAVLGVAFILTWGAWSLGQFMNGLYEAWKDNRS